MKTLLVFLGAVISLLWVDWYLSSSVTHGVIIDKHHEPEAIVMVSASTGELNGVASYPQIYPERFYIVVRGTNKFGMERDVFVDVKPDYFALHEIGATYTFNK